MYVFLTQGIIEDLEAVKQYTASLAESIAAGRRNDLKLVLIGVGQEIDRSHLEQLDHLNTGTNVDLWDYRIATEMRDAVEIFAEVVDENRIVADTGRVLDASGKAVINYSAGVPALLIFDLPREATSFSLDLGGKRITQSIQIPAEYAE